MHARRGLHEGCLLSFAGLLFILSTRHRIIHLGLISEAHINNLRSNILRKILEKRHN
jgi:hypothetical protein